MSNYSHLIKTGAISGDGVWIDIAIPVESRAEIAEALGLVSMRALTARIHLAPWRKGGIRIEGQFEARLTQSCIVTLEPVEQEVSESISRRFLPPGEVANVSYDPEIEIALDEGDPPEPLDDGEIDLGAILMEQLTLAIDPYPRKAGVMFKPGGHEPERITEREHPFAVLKTLKDSGKA